LFPGRLLVQPENRGTGPAIMLAAMAVRGLAEDAPIVILPSDHDVADDAGFMDGVADAIAHVTAHPQTLVLIGVEPDGPETDYGWIEPAVEADSAITPINRFCEKPSAVQARAMLERGCLWNSFVMVGWAGAFEQVVRAATPDVAGALSPAGFSPRTP